MATIDPFDRTPEKSDYLWRQTRLIPALKKKKEEDWRNYIDNFKKWDAAIAFRKSGRSSQFEYDLFSEKDYSIWARSMVSLLEIKEEREFKKYEAEILSLLFKIEEGSYIRENRFVSILLYGLQNINQKEISIEDITIIANEFVNYLFERLKLGKEYGLFEPDFLLLIKNFKELSKKKNIIRSAFRKNYEKLIYIQNIIGNEMSERLLVRRLNRIQKLKMGNQEKMLIKYRMTICYVYLGEWEKINETINEIKESSFENWSTLWIGFLYCQINDYKNAYQCYLYILNNGRSIRERFLAVQALDLINNRANFNIFNEKEMAESLNERQTWRELKLKILEEARNEGVLLNDYDFIDKGINKFRFMIANEGVNYAIIEQQSYLFSTRVYHPVSLFYKEFNKHWLCGMPTIHLEDETIRKSLNFMLREVNVLLNIIDLMMIFPSTIRLRDLNLFETFPIFAWKYPEEWLELQMEILNRFQSVLENSYLFISKSNNYQTTLQLQFRNLSILVSEALPVFSKKSSERVLKLFAFLLKKMQNSTKENIDLEFDSIKDIYYLILHYATKSSRAEYFQLIDPSLYFNHGGSMLISRIQEFITPELWNGLRNDFKEGIINNIEKNSDLNPSYGFNFLPLFSADSLLLSKIYKIIREGLDSYREARIKEIEKSLEQKLIPESESFLTSELNSYKNKNSWVDLELENYISIIDKEGEYSNYDVDSWLTDDLQFGNFPLGSSLFDPLLILLKGKKINTVNQKIENFINRVIKIRNSRLNENNIVDRINVNYLEMIGYYYLRTKQYEKWLSLWKTSRRFFGGAIESFDLKNLREYIELGSGNDSEKIYDSLILLFIQLENPFDKVQLIKFISEMISYADVEVPGDRKYLEFVINANSLFEKYIKFGIIAIRKLKLISKTDLSDFIKNTIAGIVNENLVIIVNGFNISTLKLFLNENESLWLNDEILSPKVRTVIDKISILDYAEYAENN
ncbi:hypothetical protein [Leptospira santarosai]|uniref:hypothetical protein n=1 Tax=Leptospira santarosai TaxID=28183 RepID=UPI00117B5685|nr:hypothetical protein [Leptospira santarosai]